MKFIFLYLILEGLRIKHFLHGETFYKLQTDCKNY